MPPSRDLVAGQLRRLIDIRLLDPLEILLEGDDSVAALRTMLRIRADRWAALIVDGDDTAAVGAILRVLATLHPDDGPFDPPADWWRSPLGQALAWRVGHPIADSVSYPVAGAILGITRQGVHDLVSRGKLARHPDGGVLPSSVRDRLRRLAGHEPPPSAPDVASG